MTIDSTLQARTRPGRPRGLRHRVVGLVVAVLSAAAIWVVWRLAIDTATLRYVDVLSIDGAQYEREGSGWGAQTWAIAEPVVTIVSRKFMLAVLVVACGLALYRRRLALAVQLVVLVGGANLTSQFLKSTLPRPDVALGDSLYNSWPSGHTTVAASLSAALVLAVPRRYRPAAVVVGLAYTIVTGIGTILGSWHRPSDVIAGVLIVLAWTGVVTALDGTLEPGRVVRTAATTVTLLVGAAIATGAAAWVALDATYALGLIEFPSRAQLIVAFGGGALAVVSVTCLAFACLSGLLALADQDTGVARSLPARG
ncbi:phosphatase PAP2 family protein [Actinotalea sp.]|uniref:phosphatase PAP2 family protein n=1 Tax=Actinotalea sp. TaxID=1872145 RepID=UPI003561DF4E